MAFRIGRKKVDGVTVDSENIFLPAAGGLPLLSGHAYSMVWETGVLAPGAHTVDVLANTTIGGATASAFGEAVVVMRVLT